MKTNPYARLDSGKKSIDSSNGYKPSSSWPGTIFKKVWTTAERAMSNRCIRTTFSRIGTRQPIKILAPAHGLCLVRAPALLFLLFLFRGHGCPPFSFPLVLVHRQQATCPREVHRGGGNSGYYFHGWKASQEKQDRDCVSSF